MTYLALVSVHITKPCRKDANNWNPLNYCETLKSSSYYFCRTSAVEYYDLAKNTAKVIECYYHLEDWTSLEGMIEVLPEGDPLLETVGDMFAANAVHNEAVKAYVKLGKVKQAINLCILYNRWDMAIDLAKRYNISKISDLLTKYTTHLINQGQVMNAIQVNIQTEHYLQAAEHVFVVSTN